MYTGENTALVQVLMEIISIIKLNAIDLMGEPRLTSTPRVIFRKAATCNYHFKSLNLLYNTT